MFGPNDLLCDLDAKSLLSRSHCPALLLGGELILWVDLTGVGSILKLDLDKL